MKLQDYLNLPTKKPVIPTVAKKYDQNTLIIEYLDGEVARIDIDSEFYNAGVMSKRPLIELIKHDRLFSKESDYQEAAPTYLKENFTKNKELTELFKSQNQNIKQVWIAHF